MKKTCRRCGFEGVFTEFHKSAKGVRTRICNTCIELKISPPKKKSLVKTKKPDVQSLFEVRKQSEDCTLFTGYLFSGDCA
jgi:hypothetical protein